MKCTIGFSVTFENCVVGFYVQAPGVDYPAHAHDAEEWYLILRLLETNRQQTLKTLGMIKTKCFKRQSTFSSFFLN